MLLVIFILITSSERYNMNPKLIKVVITDDDQVRIDGKLSPIGVMESRMFLDRKSVV